jgi:hypothetical protein
MARRSTKSALHEAETPTETVTLSEDAAEATEAASGQAAEGDKADTATPAKDKEAPAQNDQTAVAPVERREHVALCHVQMDGSLKAPGTPLLLTASEFLELKSAKAVTGDW